MEISESWSIRSNQVLVHLNYWFEYSSPNPLPINCTLCLQFIPLPLTAHSVFSCTPPRSFPHRSRVYWQSGREPQIRLPPRSSTQTAGYGPYPGSCPSKPRPCSPGKPWLQTTKSPRPAVELWRKKKLQGMLDES